MPEIKGALKNYKKLLQENLIADGVRHQTIAFTPRNINSPLSKRSLPNLASRSALTQHKSTS
jgi:hypothetical protein